MTDAAPIKRSNIRGAFERARQRWRFAAIYIFGQMPPGATAVGAFRAAMLLSEFVNRERFHDEEKLIAFPAQDLLALFAGSGERTIRRWIRKLEQTGLLQTKHRFNNSNYYFLTIPPEAENHLFKCQLEITKRRKAGSGEDKLLAKNGRLGSAEVTRQKWPTTLEHNLEYSEAPNSLSSLDGSLARLEEKEGGREREEGAQEEKTPEPIAQPLLNASDKPDPPPRPTLEELRVKLNMPDLGKSPRR